MKENAETRILMTLLLTAFPERQDTVEEVKNMSSELIRILINYYSNNCTRENKYLTNYVVNSQMSGTIMEEHIKCLETCLEDLDQRRRIQMNITLKWWQKCKIYILKNQFWMNFSATIIILLTNILITIMTAPLLWTANRLSEYIP